MPPPARDVLLRQPTAKAGLDFDFYLASKHYGVHLLYKLGL